MLVQCWPAVYDGGLTSNQHWFNVGMLLWYLLCVVFYPLSVHRERVPPETNGRGAAQRESWRSYRGSGSQDGRHAENSDHGSVCRACTRKPGQDGRLLQPLYVNCRNPYNMRHLNQIRTMFNLYTVWKLRGSISILNTYYPGTEVSYLPVEWLIWHLSPKERYLDTVIWLWKELELDAEVLYLVIRYLLLLCKFVAGKCNEICDIIIQFM